MSELPDVFIQIHYHLRPGGVSTVIKRYIEAFRQCQIEDSRSYVISSCGGSDINEYEYAQLIDIEECGYQCFTSKEHFAAQREILFQKINNQFATIGDKKILVVAHNLTLAKNPALSSAICLLARKLASPEIRFFSVIHDFSEQGRADLMAQIINLEEAGVNVRNDLYCIGAPIQCIAPNVDTYKMLSDNHFPVTLLQNPIISKKTSDFSADRLSVMKGLKKVAARSRITLDIDKPVFYYPVRLISRKNIFEAIVLSCIACNATLLTGPAGKGVADSERFKTLQKFVIKNKLSVLFNAGDAIAKVLPGVTDPVSQLICICDQVISTSIAEGFGYSLYEPWVHGKSVIARKPAGFIIPQNWNGDVFYSWFPVPQEWISLSELENEYKKQYYRCYKKDLPWSIKDCMCKENTVDFSALSEKMQMQIVESVLKDPLKLGEWVSLLRKSTQLWPGVSNLLDSAQNSLPLHTDNLQEQFSENLFKKRFIECFSQLPSRIPSSIDPITIQEKFQSPHYFRLLLNPELM